jgi:hypothetical protein
MKLIYFLVILLLSSLSAHADEGILKDFKPEKDVKYIIELNNGDIFSGTYSEMVNSPDDGQGIKLKTELGTATIYESQIKYIKTERDFYRHNHRVFLMPTAEPIGNNHFAGNFELLMLYGGFGIGDIVSVTAGRTLVPSIRSDQQLSVIDTKISIMDMPLSAPAYKISFAVGANLAWINSANRLVHIYGVGTVALQRSSISAALFYKGASQDIYRINLGSNYVDMIYPDGAFGLAIGLDTRFSDYHNLHFIGELWNSYMAKPTNTAVLLGLRLCSTRFSADFGLSFFTQPFVAPFFSFVWTPFN